MMKKMALGIVLAACISSGARAATVQFDSADYFVAPGDTITVQVQFVVPGGEVAPVAAVSAKVSISGGDFPGEVTTSLGDVIQATTGTYILDDSDGFDNGGTATLIAVGGDITGTGFDENKGPDVYAFMDITWNASNDAWGDYLLTFEDVGLGTGGFTYLVNASGVDNLTGSTGATIHVPEPTSLLIWAVGAVLCCAKRRR